MGSKSRKIVIILLVLAIIILCGYIYYDKTNNNTQINKLNNEIKKIKTENKQLKKKVSDKAKESTQTNNDTSASNCTGSISAIFKGSYTGDYHRTLTLNNDGTFSDIYEASDAGGEGNYTLVNGTLTLNYPETALNTGAHSQTYNISGNCSNIYISDNDNKYYLYKQE